MPPEPPPAPDPRTNRAQRYLAVIDDLVDLGAELVQELRPAPDQPAPAPIAERAQIYDRTTRAIRLCMLLADKFEQVIAEPAQRQTHRAAARARVARDVEDSIARAPHSPADKESLTAELHDRLDRLDSIADLENRPFREIVAEILRDFGLQNSPHGPAWPRRTANDLDRLHAHPASRPPPAAAAAPPKPHPDRDHELPADDDFDDDLPPVPAERNHPNRPGSLMEWALQRARDG